MTGTEGSEASGGPRSSWAVTRHGLGVVVGLERRRLVRSRTWLVTLGVWFVVVNGLSGLLWASLAANYQTGARDDGALVLSAVVGFGLLTLGALVAPALSASSVNGDRRAETLAALQATPLTAAEIVTGRLLVASVGAATLVVAAVPALVVASTISPAVPPARILATVLVVTLTLVVVVAVGLALSTVLSTPVASSVVTYVLVVAGGLGGPVLFGLTSTLLVADVEVTDRVATTFDDATGMPTACSEVARTEVVSRTDLTWPLLVTSPYVVLADATPVETAPEVVGVPEPDLYALLARSTREAVAGPETAGREGFDECLPFDDTWQALGASEQEPLEDLTPVWGWGVAWLAVVAAVSWVVAVLRLRLPVRELPRGVRVG